jgi:Flp pilus assembly protein protease CpaA
MYAGLITAALHIWTGLHTALTLFIFACLWTGFYFAGIWAATDRPAELDKKFPTSSRELQKRKKAFYDWLDSQGRR